MSLSEVLEEIKRVRPYAEGNVEELPRETLNARRGRKAQAVESLKRLNSEYADFLRKTAAFVLVVGSKREEFTKLATENFKCFSADPDFFYSDLAGRIPQSLYLGKEGMSNVFDVLGRHLYDKAVELGLGEINQIIFRQEYRRHIATKEEFLALVKQAVNEQVGSEIVGYQAIDNLTNVAIDKNHNAKITPILLTTGDEKFALTVVRDLNKISTRTFIVAAGEVSAAVHGSGTFTLEEPTNENVKKTLKNISSTLKK